MLFNLVSKMKITTEGEKVIELLWDVIAAKGFERRTSAARQDVGALAKLEGTVHVNLALILKFMPNYLFAPTEQPVVSTRQDPCRRRVPVPPGPGARPGRNHVRRLATGLEPFAGLPNVERFREQAEGFTTLLRTAAPTPSNSRTWTSGWCSDSCSR